MVKILIIEDDKTLLESITDIIEQEGYNADKAENGKKGLELLEKNSYELVLCDIMMPELDGYKVLKYLKSSKKGIPPVFIFITAKSERADLRKGMELGADDYLTKPFTRDELVSCVESQLQKRAVIKDKIEIKEEVLDALKNKIRTLTSEGKGKKDANNRLTFDENLFLSDLHKSDFVKVNSVVFIAASGDYSKIFTKDRKSYYVRKPLKNWENKLPTEYFIRVNRSLIIGTRFIEKVEKWKTYSNRIFLTGIQEPFIISQRYSRKLRQQLKKL
jgi:DNA-binding response OmpR family regulator